MPIAIQVPHPSPIVEFHRALGENDKTISAPYSGADLANDIFRSDYWFCKVRFAEVRRQLEAAMRLGRDWDSYAADPPNTLSLQLAQNTLARLEIAALPPTRLMPSVEGGIAISFLEGGKRALMETYNTGEIVVATFSDFGAPNIWELENSQSALDDAINRIRVHLAA